MRRLFEWLVLVDAGACLGLGVGGQFPSATVDGLVLLAGWCLVNALDGGLDALNRYFYRQYTGRDP